jgi:hypothetical protein
VYLHTLASRSAEIVLVFAKLGGVEVGRGESVREIGGGKTIIKKAAVMLETDMMKKVAI